MAEPYMITPGRRRGVAGLARSPHLATARGLLPIEDVAPDDAVCLADGGCAPVAAVVPQAPQPAMCLQVQGGYALVAGPAQLLAVFDSTGAFVWRPAADLRPGDVLVLQPGRGLPPDLSSVSLPPCPSPYGHTHQTLITPVVADEELACFFGYAVGNGTLSVTSRLSWTVNLRDHEFALWFNAEAARRFALPVRSSRPYQGRKPSTRSASHHGTGWVPSASPRTRYPDSCGRAGPRWWRPSCAAISAPTAAPLPTPPTACRSPRHGRASSPR